INHSYINGRINIWGTYSVDAPINAINSYFIPKDSYYHAASGSSNTDGTNTFSTYVDVSDLYFTEKTYSLVLQAQFVNGNSNWVTFPFTFKND
ncbi:hypothetical protein R2R70_19745, partial [Cobetia sp. SIMBA_158]|uniref:hypothetical protein n=1 Tax=Cobetia sp. SIMBA_158 TaxID=3081617 RepID=UPI00397ECD6C